MEYRLVHNCIKVRDLARSLDFYARALHLHEKRRVQCGPVTLVYLGDEAGSEHELELNYKPGNSCTAGTVTAHIAFAADDFAAAKEKHRSMGCIQMEIPEAGIYFISDPDKHLIEILPADHPAARKKSFGGVRK